MTDMGSMNRNFKNPIKEVKLKVIDVCGGGERTEKIKKEKIIKKCQERLHTKYENEHNIGPFESNIPL